MQRDDKRLKVDDTAFYTSYPKAEDFRYKAYNLKIKNIYTYLMKRATKTSPNLDVPYGIKEELQALVVGMTNRIRRREPLTHVSNRN